jgi:GT2 family glycosyltransferase
MSGEGMLGVPAFPAPAPRASMPVDAAAAPTPISVVVPTRETRELTLRCLACLTAARPAAAELIVVDDGSADGTTDAIAASYPDVRLLRHEAPRGFTAAANAGAALATRELVLLLNSDTEVSADALGALAEAFAGDGGLGVAGSLLFYPDGRPQWSGGGLPGNLWLFALASGVGHGLGSMARWRGLRPVSGHGNRRVEWVTGAALAVRRPLWESLGGFDPRFELYAQDLDFCARARAAGWEVAVVPRSRVVHHHGTTVEGTAGVVAARHNAALLWADLVRWTAKHRGPRAARTAARLLWLGGGLRRGLLRLKSVGGEAARRRGEAETRSLRAAAAAARAAAAERPGA